MIGLAGFRDDVRTNAEMAEMKSELARAKREDKQILSRHAGESRSALHQMFRGHNDEGTVSAVHRTINEKHNQVNARWMKIVRERYQGSVIRRTVNSLDHEGQPISGLEPYEEHICLLKLYRHEYDALETLAEEALDSPSFPQRFSSEVRGVVCCCEKTHIVRADALTE